MPQSQLEDVVRSSGGTWYAGSSRGFGVIESGDSQIEVDYGGGIETLESEELLDLAVKLGAPVREVIFVHYNSATERLAWNVAQKIATSFDGLIDPD